MEAIGTPLTVVSALGAKAPAVARKQIAVRRCTRTIRVVAAQSDGKSGASNRTGSALIGYVQPLGGSGLDSGASNPARIVPAAHRSTPQIS